jgi:inosine-uridine nucleoside N-ribohydrolase
MPQDFQEKPPAGAFFDTDFSTIDSVLAVGLLHGLQAKRDCRVAIITVSRPNLAVAGFADAVERFYRGPAGNFAQVPPIGMITTGHPGETSPAFAAPFQKRKPDGTPLYRNEVKSVIDTADPNTLFRNYLEAQYDQNAFFVLSGPATNLAAALAFPGLKQRIAAKVKYLVIAGGAFSPGPAEAHIKADIPAAQKVFAEWPTPVVASGYEVGAALEFPGASIDKELAAAMPNNPIADAYRAYRPMPYDAPSWAMAAALYAARPREGYFKLSGPGTITVHEDGRTSFAASEGGKHRYLVNDPEQKERILQAYVELVSAKPEPRQRFRPAALPGRREQKQEQKNGSGNATNPPPK